MKGIHVVKSYKTIYYWRWRKLMTTLGGDMKEVSRVLVLWICLHYEYEPGNVYSTSTTEEKLETLEVEDVLYEYEYYRTPQCVKNNLLCEIWIKL